MAGAEQDEGKRERMKRLARRAMPVPLAVRTSDLPVRAGSAIVMLGLAAYALYQGALAWTVFVTAIALGIFIEWYCLARRFADGARLAVWSIAGAAYLGAAGFTLVWLYRQAGFLPVLALAGAVVLTDVGAYFAGRTIGGPRIAPRISPSKTWAGLAGGMVASALWLAFLMWLIGSAASAMSTMPDAGVKGWQIGLAALAGALVAMAAQAGDFFESWMKRRAGVKDSGALIPGHGGLFDRMDGMMAVAMLGFPFTVAFG